MTAAAGCRDRTPRATAGMRYLLPARSGGPAGDVRRLGLLSKEDCRDSTEAVLLFLDLEAGTVLGTFRA
jgi:hypothetical protein